MYSDRRSAGKSRFDVSCAMSIARRSSELLLRPSLLFVFSIFPDPLPAQRSDLSRACFVFRFTLCGSASHPANRRSCHPIQHPRHLPKPVYPSDCHLVVIGTLLGSDKVVVNHVKGESSESPSETREEVPRSRKCNTRREFTA